MGGYTVKNFNKLSPPPAGIPDVTSEYDWSRGPHRCNSAAWHTFYMVWLYRSPIPMGRRGCFTSSNYFNLPSLAERGRGSKVRAQPVLKYFFRYTAGKFRWRWIISRNFRHNWQKKFCSMYESSLRHPVWVPEINVTACNSEYKNIFVVIKEALQSIIFSSE